MKEQSCPDVGQSEGPGPRLRILGIRGIPAKHGGFETFAEQLAKYLVARGWHVTVYCQETGEGPIFEDHWHGIHRVRIPSGPDTAVNSIKFDWKSIRHAAKKRDLCLTLGYNTAVFCAWLRLKGVPNVINMDGIEYTRAKWGRKAKLWFRLNELAGCRLGNHLIADHPEIKNHLLRKAAASKITVIPYGGDKLAGVTDEPIRALGLKSSKFLTVIARPEPENSLLEIVQGFSARRRDMELIVLGNFLDQSAFHRKVKAAASEEVRFLGAIYDKKVVQALRYHSTAYIHGHQVGGTNPSLVEALGAGNAVIAHDNRFNRWVAGPQAKYFSSASDLATCLDEISSNSTLLQTMKQSSVGRLKMLFTWESVLNDYEQLLRAHMIIGHDAIAVPKPQPANASTAQNESRACN